MSYKWTLQSKEFDDWAQVEVNIQGKDIPNRNVKINTLTTSYTDTIERFKKIGDGKVNDNISVELTLEIPEALNKDEYIVLGSNINNWNPEVTDWIATKMDETHYSILVDLNEYADMYKKDTSNTYVKIDEDGYISVEFQYKWIKIKEGFGTWKFVECKSDGSEVDNRVINVSNKTDKIDKIDRFRIIGEGMTVRDTSLECLVTLPFEIDDDTHLTMASNLNNWNPNDPRWKATHVKGNTYRLYINLTKIINDKLQEGFNVLDDEGNTNINIEYKWTLQSEETGEWEQVELTSDRYNIENRNIRITTGINNINDIVETFKEKGESVVEESTITGDIETTELQLYDSKLYDFRTIRILLPSNYNVSDKNKYPVIYMHD